MDNKYYLKKMTKRSFSRSEEYKAAGFSVGASWLLALIIFLSQLPRPLALGYGAIAFIQTLIFMGIKRDIKKHQILKKSTRRLGYILILLGLSGNIFCAISGFSLVQERKSIEYTLSYYGVLSNFGIMMVSGVNLFKPYVANTFLPGMFLLAALTLIQIGITLLMGKYGGSGNLDKRFLPVAIYAMLNIFIGNLLCFLLGLILFSRIKHKRQDISIEWIDVLKRLFRNYMSVLGLFVVTFLLSLSICSHLTFDYDIAIDNNYQAILQAPSLMFPFGTDNFGRCAFTRIVFGARISLIVGMLSTAVPIFIGGILGAFSGYYGNRLDNIIMRLLDVVFAVPGILLAIAIVAAFGANTFNLIMALSIGYIPIYARTVRATVMGISNMEFVEAAKACGARNFEIVFQHIMPNSLAPIIVRATLGIGGAVLSTSALSYLGLGVEPHIPEWGNILKVGSNYLETAPYLAIFPGLAIIVIVLAFNYFGDGLRDALDPKLK